MYEEEHLLLHMQEMIAAAIDDSGLSQAEVARRLGVNRSFVTQALGTGRNLTIATCAGLLWATGHRICTTTIERLPDDPSALKGGK
jgi:plasmid maintenance system antidote protein VapI